ncbi:Helix-turn-helix protein [Bernardetia litoralis DSM 6794]|uniref:Helix-turn-helix protein n=1 Tax=Bernardetia litoralis (strain ATCC 23117 / DSM 6794 / NBRC 15988 / NCIMB 1366 / Fx l1 / Sio-4) TaxID=880071 RepID=I4AF87_BERLS|nr:Helix-turn-helix protein [Bernardetia litoralis]AFM02622.1 Helix-turn-helix protein [Bernardetia litoralis DSM 6794]
MKKKTGVSVKLLNEPSYWVEEINGMLYDAILDYMEKNKLNRTQLAVYLEISKKELSQLLTDGDNNFSVEKILEISLALGKFPVFSLEDKKEYLREKKSN